MKGKIYTDIAEELKRLGGIDEIGVVSAAGQSAIIYAGNKDIKKYYDGSKIQSVIFPYPLWTPTTGRRRLWKSSAPLWIRLPHLNLLSMAYHRQG